MMPKLRDVGLSTTLAVSFGSILLFVTITGALALMEINKLKKNSYYLYNEIYRVNKALRNIQYSIRDVEKTMSVLSKNKNSQLPETRSLSNRLEEIENQIDKEFDYVFSHYDGPEIDIEKAYNAYKLWKPKQDQLTFDSSFFYDLNYSNLENLNYRIEDIFDFNNRRIDDFFNLIIG